MQHQELSNWCWAAIAASLSAFYGGRQLAQAEVAADVLGYACSGFRADPELAARCNVCARLDDALKAVGGYSHWSPGKPTFARIRTEIDAGRPVCFGLDWLSGGFHYAVVTGYYADAREIYVADPLHGPSVQAFEPFPSRYRGSGGVWRGTFWTAKEMRR